MANQAISDLYTANPITSLTGAEYLEGVQSGSSGALQISTIRTYLLTSQAPGDISAATGENITLAVPAASSNYTGRRYRIAAYGGDGTYTAYFTTIANVLFPDQTTVTVANAAIKGNGYCEIECDGSNWNVVGYEDTWTEDVTDDQVTVTTVRIIKRLDGELIQRSDTATTLAGIGTLHTIGLPVTGTVTGAPQQAQIASQSAGNNVNPLIRLTTTSESQIAVLDTGSSASRVAWIHINRWY